MADLDICRICLNTDVRGYNFNEHNLRNHYESLIRSYVNEKEGLPLWFCYECAMMLHKFHKFREKCFKGQLILREMTWSGKITYESVVDVDRYANDLASPVSIVQSNQRVQLLTEKHCPKSKKPKTKVNIDLLNHKVLKKENIIDTVSTKALDMGYEKVEVKQEESVADISNKHDDDDMINDEDLDNDEPLNYDETLDNDGPLNNDLSLKSDVPLNNDDAAIDTADDAVSSDDENIFLDIVKKAVNGENKLVFLKGLVESKPKKNSKKKKSFKNTKIIKSAKEKKFAKEKKEFLTPEHWKKYNLSEEDAVAEFKERANSEKYLKANYKCHNCYKGFSKIDMLMRHVKLRHDQSLGALECRFCHMRFRLKCLLGRHMRQHYAVYHCLRCDMTFRLENSAIFHEDYHNGVKRKCKHCGEEFMHASTYYTHVRMSHRSAHVCTRCGVSYVSAAGLQQHCRIKHFDATEQQEGDTAEGDSDPGESTTYCEKCDIKFVSAHAYDEHLVHSALHADAAVDAITGRRNTKGKKCGTHFKGPRKKKPTTCIHCGKHFTTQAACMKHHLAEHPRRTFYPPDQRHICEVCGASLAAVSIASHMNRHTRERIYTCDTCGMQFISKSSHHRHQVTHTGERPYPCPLCEKRFTQKNSMQLHYRTFHLKQPYPKRNRRKKTDEVPLLESCRDESADGPPPPRWLGPRGGGD